MFKTILYGQFSFNREKSFHTVRQTSRDRLLTHYREDIIFDLEAAFEEREEDSDETSYFLLHKKSHSSDLDKSFRNTLGMIEHIAEFATSGKVRLWLVKDGKLKEHVVVEPTNDHTCVRLYHQGMEKLEAGEYEQAVLIFNKSIKQNDKHAQAYEDRGLAKVQLKEYEQALSDFTTCIDLAPRQPEAYYYRAKLYRVMDNLPGAVADFADVCQYAIPHQPLYWDAKRQRGECLLAIGDTKEALREWRLLNNMNFKEGHSHFRWKPYFHYRYGETLLQLEQYKDALEALNKAKTTVGTLAEEVPLELHDVLYLRYIAMRDGGMKGHARALKEAAQAGSGKAKDLLK